MTFSVVIPARYQSSRLPGKPLLDIAGKPMIQRVVDQARLSEATAVYVATDDKRIKDYCDSNSIEVCMTSANHSTGTDRIEEVTRQLKLVDEDIVVNVQGDEPLIPPAVINQVAHNLQAHSEAGICTLYETISSLAEFNNPNAVKLLTDEQGLVLTFSRASIPFVRDDKPEAALALAKRHIGIYAYRVKVLHQFVTWPVTELESLEKLEQLRAMYHGIRIHADKSRLSIPAGVDTQADLDHIRTILSTN